MERETQRERQFAVYLPAAGQTVSVSEDTYLAYYRPIWRLCKRRARAGQCRVGFDWWNCRGDCGLCPYRAEGSGPEELTDEIPDSRADIETGLCEKELSAALRLEIGRLNGPERFICRMIMLGRSDTETAKLLGISRTTYIYRKKKLLARLRKALEDYA